MEVPESEEERFLVNSSSQKLARGYANRAERRIGRCHPLDGITNLKYKLLHFLTPNKKKHFKEKGTSF
jgi:hypothetical protein